MIRSLSALVLTSAFSVTTPSPAVAARDVGVLVSGIEKQTGEIICQLYSGERGFPREEGDLLQTVRYPAGAELITCTFPGVEPGRYAVSVMHDENGNGEFDTNFMGFPKEPWGVSNNIRPDRRAPRFREASVTISEDQLASFEVVLER
jgi:uncharacterized protein (DUF2141 family)